jgi:hypothetical protein
VRAKLLNNFEFLFNIEHIFVNSCRLTENRELNPETESGACELWGHNKENSRPCQWPIDTTKCRQQLQYQQKP